MVIVTWWISRMVLRVNNYVHPQWTERKETKMWTWVRDGIVIYKLYISYIWFHSSLLNTNDPPPLMDKKQTHFKLFCLTILPPSHDVTKDWVCEASTISVQHFQYLWDCHISHSRSLFASLQHNGKSHLEDPNINRVINLNLIRINGFTILNTTKIINYSDKKNLPDIIKQPKKFVNVETS